MFSFVFRYFSIQIPKHHLVYSFSRSSGPGGQNVNKVNSKVDVRFNIAEANWLPEDTKTRLRELFPQFINKDDEFFIQSQSKVYLESRDQRANENDAIEKLQMMVDKAHEPEKVRQYKEAEEHPEKREYRIKLKRARSEIKSVKKEKFDRFKP